MTTSIVERLRSAYADGGSYDLYHQSADLIEQQAKEIAELKALAKKMADALEYFSTMTHMYQDDRVCCASKENEPHADDCATMLAISVYRELIKE